MIRVTAAVIEHEGRVLLAQRPAGHRLAGLWEFPGGKLEPGETPEACLRRELREELGVETEIGEFVGSFPHEYPGLAIDLLVFRARLAGAAAPEAREHAALAWRTLEECAALPLAPADAPALARLRALAAARNQEAATA